MFGSAIIVFREVLEAALIIGLIMAATRGIPRRGRWIGAGVVAGLAGAGVVAFFAESLATMAAGAGQELFNAGVLLLAVGMLGWHQIWMRQNGRDMRTSFNHLGQSLQLGERNLQALAVVVGTAILREGSEAVLFLYGVATSAGAPIGELISGALAGLGCGMVCGAGLYLGLLRIPPRWLFGVTGWLIVLLAAAMAAQAGALLVQAGVLPALVDEVWDSSAWLARSSPAGQLLHILVGYDDRPCGMQLLLYGATIFGITHLSHKMAQRPAAMLQAARPGQPG